MVAELECSGPATLTMGLRKVSWCGTMGIGGIFRLAWASHAVSG